MREMTAPALKKQFEGRDAVFLYISVSDPEAKWYQTLDSQHFTSPNSVHLHSATTAEAEAYQITSFLTYFLIGRDRRFLKVNAARPSDGAATVAALEAALKD